MKQPIIWIINPYDPLPSDSQQPIRYTYLAEALARKGLKVVWWTSSFDHNHKKQRSVVSQQEHGQSSYQIKAIQVPCYSSNTGFARLWNHLIFEFRFYQKAIQNKERPDVILASLPPLITPWIAMRLSKRWRSIGVIDVQDLWPEAFETFLSRLPKPLRRALLSPLYLLRNSTVINATSVTGVSNTYVSKVAHEAPEKHQTMFVLGADVVAHEVHAEASARFPEKKETEQWFLRSGVVGHFCDIDLLVSAAKQLSTLHPEIKLIIAGRGPGFPELRKQVTKYNLNNLFCYESVSFNELVYLHRISDATLCLYTESAPHSLVNKAFDSMAAGKAIINSVPGEMASLIEKECIGINYQAGDLDSFLNAIVTLGSQRELRSQLGANARRLAEERYDKKVVYDRYADWVLRQIQS